VLYFQKHPDRRGIGLANQIDLEEMDKYNYDYLKTLHENNLINRYPVQE
jgi:hypothetical protein